MTRSGAKDTLWERNRVRLDVPLLALAALAAWGIGLTLPMVATEKLIGSDQAYSVLSGLWELARSSYLYLAVPLFLFSVAFPGAKLLLLLYTWFVPMESGRREPLLHWLDRLGKWSMLDAYVVVLMAGALQLGILAETVLREGVYVFGGGILLSMVAASLARGVAGAGGGRHEVAAPTEPVVHLPILAAASIVLFLLGISRPLLKAEKWVFWENDYSLLEAAGGMVGSTPVLGLGFVLFILLLPLVQQVLLLSLGVAQWTEGPGSGLGRALFEVERWAMTDVLVLALIVVFIRLANIVQVQPRVGVAYLAGAVLFTAYTSYRIRRLYTSGRS